LSLVLLAALPAPVHARQPDPHRAGLVVVHGDGSVASACVAFSEESISGAELLRRSGVEVTLGDYGGATAVPEPLPPTVTPAPLPSAAPALPAPAVGEGSEDAEPAAQAGAGGRSTSVWSYSVFGIVILGLGGLLLVARSRGRRA